ncbi:MAG: substrate-binding domain-containing protein [Desulfopila sp.]
MKSKALWAVGLLLMAIVSSTPVMAGRDYITIVGSSTVYPFATVVAEHFARTSHFKSPKIEATGSGDGFKLFCSGIELKTPDITDASRSMEPLELADCTANGVQEIVEVKIGYDGIVVANAKQHAPLPLSRKQLYLALAKEVPDPRVPGKLRANPFRNWSDIDPSLPPHRIEIYGPPPTSGTRDAFVELVMDHGAATYPFLKDMAPGDFVRIARTLREDGAYVTAGENDNLIVQKLRTNPIALGIFGFSFLDQNSDFLQGSSIENQHPTLANIASGDYPLSRPLFFYVKKAHVGIIPGIREYLNEFSSDRAWGENGYLAEKGLIPMPAAERDQYRKIIRDLSPRSIRVELKRTGEPP